MKTKFRDIPFEETLACVDVSIIDSIDIGASQQDWIENSRGKLVHIKPYPSAFAIKLGFACAGPFYETVLAHRPMVVCCHMIDLPHDRSGCVQDWT